MGGHELGFMEEVLYTIVKVGPFLVCLGLVFQSFGP